MLNMVCLVGNLTRDIELRYTQTHKAVASLGLASNRRYKVGEEYKEETLFINAILWGKRAENAAEYLRKGDPVFIVGRLQSRNWETKEGQKRTTIEIAVEDIQFLNRAKKGTSPEADEMETEPNVWDEEK